MMFGTLLTTAFALLLAYSLWRASSVPFLSRRVSRKGFAISGLLLFGYFLLGRFIGHNSPGMAAMLLDLSAMTFMAIFFLVAVSFLALDILTLFGLLFPQRAPFLRSCALVAGLALSAIALIQGLRPPAVVDYEIRLEGLPAEADGLVIAAISDTHLGSLLEESWLNKRVTQVMEIKPDLIALVGDMVEGHGAPDERLSGPFRRLTAPLGVWAVNGNHDYHGANGNTPDFFERLGIRVLRDSGVTVRPGLFIAGVDDLTFRRRIPEKEDPIARALANRPPGAAILLSHSPLRLDEAERAGAGLMICGHTHGGQIWPFGYLSRAFYPVVAGLKQVGKMSVIVCRGTGTWGPRMRLWNRGEIMRVTLRSPDVSKAH